MRAFRTIAQVAVRAQTSVRRCSYNIYEHEDEIVHDVVHLDAHQFLELDSLNRLSRRLGQVISFKPYRLALGNASVRFDFSHVPHIDRVSVVHRMVEGCLVFPDTIPTDLRTHCDTPTDEVLWYGGVYAKPQPHLPCPPALLPRALQFDMTGTAGHAVLVVDVDVHYAAAVATPGRSHSSSSSSSSNSSSNSSNDNTDHCVQHVTVFLPLVVRPSGARLLQLPVDVAPPHADTASAA